MVHTLSLDIYEFFSGIYIISSVIFFLLLFSSFFSFSLLLFFSCLFMIHVCGYAVCIRNQKAWGLMALRTDLRGSKTLVLLVLGILTIGKQGRTWRSEQLNLTCSPEFGEPSWSSIRLYSLVYIAMLPSGDSKILM
ncbi:hypothetical protein BJX61DRAFT_442232 [Aspergillus egyptiacus]|nr:hypothetical protein BJX61DRAFT_442232 [Aspergillus egyptiacus]